MKTGWGIVQDLVAKVAAVHEPDDPDAGARAAADPESWWEARFGEPLGYSRLLAEAAPTPAARQALLAGYFEPADGEDAGKQPTAAHRALARLVKRGSIKVILTTNFDCGGAAGPRVLDVGHSGSGVGRKPVLQFPVPELVGDAGDP
ncbi:hypothetical protein OG900_38820 [Streptomyces sp. NBC_00433]